RRDLEGVAEDEDSVRTGAGIQIGGDAGEAAEIWHERRQVQLHEYHQESIDNLGSLCRTLESCVP
ncbi:unnamed protein product, partial [Musa banksii]